MKLKRLYIHNFLSYEDSTIDFNNVDRITMIVGAINGNLSNSNGSGKSTLLEAILYALYERSRLSDNKNTTLDDLVRDGSDGQMEIQLEFESSNHTYKITRTRDATKSKGTCKFELLSNNKWKLLTAEKKTATNQQIVDIVGIDYQTFVASVCFQATEVDNFVKATNSERKAIIQNILQLDKYDRFRLSARTKLESAKDDLKFVEAQMSTINYSPLDIEEKQNSLKDINKQIDLYSLQKTSIQSQLEKLRRDQIQHNEQIEKKGSLFNQLVDKRKMLQRILSNQASALQKQEDYAKVLEAKKAEFSNLETQYNEIKDKFLIEKSEILTEGKRASLYLKDCEAAHDAASESFFNLKGKISSKEEKINEIAALHDSQCPTCYNVITAESRHDGISLLENEKRVLILQQESEGKALDTLKVQLNAAKDKVEEIKERVNQYNQWIKEKNFLKERLTLVKQSGQEAKMIAEDQKTIIVENKSFIAQYEKEISELEKQYDAIVVDQVKFDQLNNQIEEKNSNLERTNTLLTQVSISKGRIQTEIDTFKQGVEKIKLLTTQRDSLVKEKFYYEKLAEMFGKQIPTLIIENSCKEIEIIANNILNSISDLSVEFITQQANKDGTMREVFEIKVKSPNWTKDKFIDNLSTGQRFRVVFAVRIALSKLLVRRRSSTPIEFLFYDECFASLDGQGIDQVIDIFKFLKTEFTHQLVITHQSELKERFGNNVILVSQKNGVSKVTA